MRVTRRAEAGFTLVELIVTIAILGLISVPLLAAFIQALDTTGSASSSLGVSHDVQLADYYLQQDALGGDAAQSIDATWACAVASGLSTSVAAAQGVVQFSWSQAPVYTGTTLASGLPVFGPGLTYEADYLFTGTALTRYYCVSSGGVPGAPRVTRVASTLTAAGASIATCTNKSLPCTTVTLTDAAGRTFSTVLNQRTTF